MSMANGGEQMPATVGLEEGLGMLLKERDALRLRNNWLEAELVRLEAVNQRLGMDRDYYLRATVEMTANFTNAIAIMNDAVGKARTALTARTGQPQPAPGQHDKISAQDEARLRELANEMQAQVVHLNAEKPVDTAP